MYTVYTLKLGNVNIGKDGEDQVAVQPHVVIPAQAGIAPAVPLIAVQPQVVIPAQAGIALAVPLIAVQPQVVIPAQAGIALAVPVIADG
jgi:hypothetical protein